MSTARKTADQRKSRLDLLNEAMPQFEQFIESRESYIKALETAIEALRRENQKYNQNNLEIRSSIDELVALQRLSNTIGTSVNPEEIARTLIDLTTQVLPVIETNIFLFDSSTARLSPLTEGGSTRLHQVAQEQLEAGIVDWVLSENKTVVIPDLESLAAVGTSRNLVIVPLILRNQPIGVYVIHTTKAQTDFSNQDIQLLTVLAHQAAAGIENWRTYDQLVQANEQLKASQAQMLQAAKLAAIGEMAAGVLHEIKNPLQIMMMHLDMVERNRAMPNWIEMFGQQVRRLSDIAKRLMNFSRNVEFTMDAVDVNKAILDVVAIISHEFRSNQITIDLQLATPVTAITGNANYLQQVFLNLFINARDAMPQGGTLTIGTTYGQHAMTVTVADSGTGIDPENMEKIFGAFFTTKGEGKGTGLGLSICNKIVEQHGGTITVSSTVGQGTTFTITIPYRRRIP